MIELLLINALWITGFYFACDYEQDINGKYHYQILGRLGRYMDTLPEWISKPVCGCMPCMASIHGLAVSLMMADYGISQTLIHIIALSGTMKFITKWLN
jgi:hypothetical protein